MNFKKILLTSMIVTTGIIGTAVNANATSNERVVNLEKGKISNTTVEREGGTWSYDVNDIEVYSHYHHPKKVHGASVVNGDDVWERKYNRLPGDWAKASVYSTWWGNKAYYNIGYR